MANYKPYEKYKDSGNKWFGEVPNHWELKKIKRIGRTKAGGTSSTANSNYWDGNIPWLPSGKLQNNVIKSASKFITEDGLNNSSTKLIRANTTLIALTGATCANIGYLTFESTANQSVIAIEEDDNNDSKFLFYSLINQRKQILLNQNGGAQAGINDTDVRNIISVFPPLSEQTAIARFLDYKLSKINRFIRKKKQLIKLLEEKKAAIINQAVTKGLNPNTKMKNSGIEWLGEIPEHWEVTKIRGVCSFVRGNSTFKKDELLSDGKFVALQYGKTYKVTEVDNNYQFYVNEEFYKESQTVHLGDVIFVSTSETMEDLGHSVYYNRNDIGLLGGEQILLKPKKNIISGKYLHYSTFVIAKELRKFATGVKVYRFNINDLKTIYTFLPPLPEQHQIVSYIEQETFKIDTTISHIEKEIALVEEYKTALIAEAVTGKIDVRNYELGIVNYELEEELEEEMDIAAEDTENYETEDTE